MWLLKLGGETIQFLRGVNYLRHSVTYHHEIGGCSQTLVTKVWQPSAVRLFSKCKLGQTGGMFG